MNRIILLSSLLLLLSCSPKVETEYVEVYIPVKAPIEKPNKPTYASNDTAYTYLPKVLNYTRGLEYVIDVYNESINVTE